MANNFQISGDFYVSTLDGNDSNDGSPENPFKTIGAGITAADAAGTDQIIVVGTGVYNETLAMNASAKRHTFKGDGRVILDGTGLSYGMTGNPGYSNIEDFTFSNYTGTFSYQETKDFAYTRCKFKSIGNYYATYHRYFSTYVSIFNHCIFEDVTGFNGMQCRVGIYNNCTFVGGHPALPRRHFVYAPYIYYQQYDNCVFIAKEEDEFLYQGQSRNTGIMPSFKNCTFDQKGLFQFYDGSSYPTGSFNDWVNGTSQGPGNVKLPFFNCQAATMSINENISGSGEMSLAMSTMPINAQNSEMFRNHTGAPVFMLPGGRALATAYSHDSSSANPLHPMGGAVLSNITTGSLGGFQIDDGTEGSGSITSAVIDQGSSKVIREIDAAFVTGAPNAAAPSTFPSGSNNSHPVRFQYEMRYGDSTPSGDYKIFEWGKQPIVNPNGTGNGDIAFETGSTQLPVSARYLQLRITLRNNMSGSL